MNIKELMSGELFAVLLVVVMMMVGVKAIPPEMAGDGTGPTFTLPEPPPPEIIIKEIPGEPQVIEKIVTKYVPVPGPERVVYRHREDPTFVFSAKDERYNFGLGSAVVPESFRADLLRNHIKEFARRSWLAGYTTCEVIGHTDETAVGSSLALDDETFVRQARNGDFAALSAGSNVELGMLRALAVAHILEEERRKGNLGKIRFIKAYSAGQLVKLDQSRADGSGGADKARRRIEIRLVK